VKTMVQKEEEADREERYGRLVREYTMRLKSGCGSWEKDLKRKIEEVIVSGLENGDAWAPRAAKRWGVVQQSDGRYEMIDPRFVPDQYLSQMLN